MIFDWRTEINRYRYYFNNFQVIAKRKDLRSFGELSLTLLVISFFVFFAIKPTLVIVAGLTKEIKEKEQTSQNLQKKIASLVAAQQEYSLNQNRFYLVDQALPETPDFPLLILSVEKEATASGVTLESISITKIEIKTPDKANPDRTEVPSFEFSSSVTGSYENLKLFLSKVESLRRVLSLDTINFGKTKSTQKESSKIILNISGQVNFYPRKENYE